MSDVKWLLSAPLDDDNDYTLTIQRQLQTFARNCISHCRIHVYKYILYIHHINK